MPRRHGTGSAGRDRSSPAGRRPRPGRSRATGTRPSRSTRNSTGRAAVGRRWRADSRRPWSSMLRSPPEPPELFSDDARGLRESAAPPLWRQVPEPDRWVLRCRASRPSALTFGFAQFSFELADFAFDVAAFFSGGRAGLCFSRRPKFIFDFFDPRRCFDSGCRMSCWRRSCRWCRMCRWRRVLYRLPRLRRRGGRGRRTRRRARGGFSRFGRRCAGCRSSAARDEQADGDEQPRATHVGRCRHSQPPHGRTVRLDVNGRSVG
jgi:hypothetical protein